MDLRLDGKVAVVTGASKGIGKAIAAALAASGAQVMLSSRKADAVAAAAADMEGDVATLAAHAGHPEEAEACLAATVERFGGLDILVNNAATNPYQGATLDIDLPRFDKTVEVNWRGPLVWVQAARRLGLGARPGASVLNIASIGGLSVEPSIGIYNGTKAALLHLTRTLALEMAPEVRVNALAPGLVKTDLARALWEPHEEAVASHVPMRRLGEPDDLASAAVFLSSDAASWITGSTLVVDGGMMQGRV